MIFRAGLKDLRNWSCSPRRVLGARCTRCDFLISYSDLLDFPPLFLLLCYLERVFLVTPVLLRLKNFLYRNFHFLSIRSFQNAFLEYSTFATIDRICRSDLGRCRQNWPSLQSQQCQGQCRRSSCVHILFCGAFGDAVDLRTALSGLTRRHQLRFR